MYQSIELITPLHAKQILENNGINRKKRAGTIKILAESIKRGEWKCTHQGIAISKDGVLLDGQHRLEAIALSGISVPVVIWRDVDASTFDVLDKGISRTATDSLGIDRETVQVLNFINAVFINHTSKLTSGQVSRLYKVFGITSDSLNDSCPTNARTFGSAGVRSAVVLLTMMGDTKCFGLFRKLNLSEFNDLPDSVNVFVKRIVSNNLLRKTIVRSGSSTQIELFFSSMFALSSNNYSNSRLPKYAPEGMIQYRKMIQKIMESAQ